MILGRRRARLAAVVVTTLLLAGCSAAEPPDPSGGWAERAAAFAAELPQRPGPYAGVPRLAPDLPPPTNSWVSGPVFGDGLPAYTGTIAVTPRADGFAIDLPRVHATARTIFAVADPVLAVSIPSTGVELSGLDDLVARWRFDGAGDLVTAEGWPYAAYSAASAETLRVAGADDPERVADEMLVVSARGVRYALVAPAAALDEYPELPLAADDTLFVVAVPDGAATADLDELRRHAVLLEGASVAHTTDEGVVTTTYALRTEGDRPTLWGAFPGAVIEGEPTGMSYPTLYGEVDLRSGTSFERSTPAVAAAASLDLREVPEDELDAVRDQVRRDVASTAFTAADSYGAGKQLYRAATLSRLAGQLGLTSEAATLRAALLAELDAWLDPSGCADRAERCFVYDPELGGVVGLGASFGSDEFNDHHFHYGYILSALGMLAADDPGLVERYRRVADLLALDLASPVDSEFFPRRRVFDAYRGHSWASGLAPFRDGNNQESVSEAVSAWNGLALWARASGNDPLRADAEWMLSLETEAAVAHWLSPRLPTGFEAPFVAINWAGKRDYATFFDATPSAILGIQLIPLPPATAFLPEPARAAALAEGAFDGTLGELPLVDYVIMLEATADPDAAAEGARLLPEGAIDGANSRAYLLAWIAVQRLSR